MIYIPKFRRYIVPKGVRHVIVNWGWSYILFVVVVIGTTASVVMSQPINLEPVELKPMLTLSSERSVSITIPDEDIYSSVVGVRFWISEEGAELRTPVELPAGRAQIVAHKFSLPEDTWVVVTGAIVYEYYGAEGQGFVLKESDKVIAGVRGESGHVKIMYVPTPMIPAPVVVIG